MLDNLTMMNVKENNNEFQIHYHINKINFKKIPDFIQIVGLM